MKHEIRFLKPTLTLRPCEGGEQFLHHWVCLTCPAGGSDLSSKEDAEKAVKAHMSNFTQADKDYLVLMVRQFTARDREVVAVVLEALSTGPEWTSEELLEISKLVRGEQT